MTATDPLAPLAPQSASTTDDSPLDLGAFHVLRDVEVEVTIEIGRKRMRIADVLRLSAGQTIELSKAAGEPVDIYVNGQLLGRGEAVVLGDRYGVRVTELMAPEGGGRP